MMVRAANAATHRSIRGARSPGFNILTRVAPWDAFLRFLVGVHFRNCIRNGLPLRAGGRLLKFLD